MHLQRGVPPELGCTKGQATASRCLHTCATVARAAASPLCAGPQPQQRRRRRDGAGPARRAQAPRAVVFAAAVRNAPLQADFAAMATQRGGVPAWQVEAVAHFASAELKDAAGACATGASSAPPRVDVSGVDTAAAQLVLVLARVCAASPVQVGSNLVALVGARLRPAQAVELFTWLSVLGMLQRLYAIYLPEACLQ
jgi:hypothetical protein